MRLSFRLGPFRIELLPAVRIMLDVRRRIRRSR